MLRGLQRYSVQIHPKSLEKIKGNVEKIKDEYWVLNNMNSYSKSTGLNLESEANYSVLIA
jgi:hypothetical protein